MKPHIKKVNGLWSCNGVAGVTPFSAYHLYRIEVGFAVYMTRKNKCHKKVVLAEGA